MSEGMQEHGRAEARRLTLREWGSRAYAMLRSQLPWLIHHHRTVAGVGAYFDLITDDGRLFFGDSFHLGYFRTGTETLHEAHDALTDLVTGLARIKPGSRVLDLGCGIGEPAVRIARGTGCRIVAVNASREQVRQGRLLVARAGLADRIDLCRGDALALESPDECFDSVVCLEAAGDICVTREAKDRLVSEIWRVLRPGGHVGFCDLAFVEAPTPREDKTLRAVLYHTGSELVTDWPTRFLHGGFKVEDYRDVHAATLPTWRHVQEVYALRTTEVDRRYGKMITRRMRRQVRDMVATITRCGSYPTFSAQKPD
jgi:cyclopropane fatty-acyl-phospholipid synthase-like methyltransferase